MIEGAPELREDEQALVGPVEEALVAEQGLEPRKLRFRPGRLDGLGLLREVPELGDLLPYLFGVPGQGHGFEHPFEALALAFLHLLDLVRAGEIRRRGASQRRNQKQIGESFFVISSKISWERGYPSNP